MENIPIYRKEIITLSLILSLSKKVELGETSRCFAFQLVFNLELYKQSILLSAVFNEITPPHTPQKTQQILQVFH